MFKMKNSLILLALLSSATTNAVTTYGGHVDISKESTTILEITYRFTLSQADTNFTASNFSSTLSCPSTGQGINLNGFVQTSERKEYVNCAQTIFNWVVSYQTTIDLSDTTYNAIVNCCNLRVDATCGTRHPNINTLSTSATSFYIFTDFENCTTLKNRTAAHSNFSNYTRNCLNQPFFYNNGMYDTANFDSLSYRLVSPLTSHSTSVNHKAPYSGIYPLQAFDTDGDGKGNITLDPLTGDFIYTPTLIDQMGPAAILITEWRKDSTGSYAVVSEMHKEVLIETKLCPENNPPSINGPYTYKVCEGETLCFNIETEDVTFIPPPPAPIPSPDSVRVSWNNSIPEATFSIINPRVLHPVGRFCWTPEIGQASSLPYTFIVAARDNSCPLNAITRRSFRITVNEKGKANTSYTKDTDSTLAVSTTFISTRGTHSIKRILMDIDKNPILDNSIARFASSGSYLSVTKNDHIILNTTGVYSVQTEVNNSPLNCPTTYLDTLYYHTAAVQRSDLQRLKIHPNPATSIIYLPSSLDYVIISNSIGQIVREETHTDVLEIGDLPDGIYYLRGEKNQAIYNAKLIKK
jgi:hypothetical protein